MSIKIIARVPGYPDMYLQQMDKRGNWHDATWQTAEAAQRYADTYGRSWPGIILAVQPITEGTIDDLV